MSLPALLRPTTIALTALLALTLPSLEGAARADSSGATAPDTVFLKNGGRLRGSVVEEDPTLGVTIKLLDGTTRKVPRATIAKVEYAEVTIPLVPIAPAAPTPTYVVPQASPFGAPPPYAYGAPGAPQYVVPGAVPAFGGGKYENGLLVPPGFHVESHRRKGLWITGLVLDLGFWAARAIITINQCGQYGPEDRGCNGQDYGGAATPIIGAWIQLSKGVGGDDGNPPAGAVALVASGVAEGLGFAFLVAGLASSHRVVVADGNGSNGSLLHLGSIQFFPTASARGVGVVGMF